MSSDRSVVPGTVSDIWRSAALMLAGTVISMLGAWATFWIAFTKDAPNRAEMIEAIRTHAPYNNERQSIFDRMNKIASDETAQDRQLQEFHTRQVVNERAIESLQNELRELKKELAKKVDKPEGP